MKTVKIGEIEYVVKKMSPHAIATIANLLGRLNVEGRKFLKGLGQKEGDQFVWGILAVVTGTDLIKASAALIGCDEKYAEENFDLSWVIDALKIQMEISNIGGLISNFTSDASPQAS